MHFNISSHLQNKTEKTGVKTHIKDKPEDNQDRGYQNQNKRGRKGKNKDGNKLKESECVFMCASFIFGIDSTMCSKFRRIVYIFK